MKEFLSLGTIVLLKNSTKKVMIVGYLPVTGDKKIFRYSGVIYPEGYASADKLLLFYNSDISKVLFNGMENDEQKAFIEKINDFIKNNTNNK